MLLHINHSARVGVPLSIYFFVIVRLYSRQGKGDLNCELWRPFSLQYD